MRVQWELLHPRMTMAHLGFIPHWLHDDDPDTAAAQIHKHYTFGGGWDSFKGFTLQEDDSLTYPGDPPMKPLARAHLRNETILFYDHSWVAVVQPDRSFEAARID